jgi:hypothetical protein
MLPRPTAAAEENAGTGVPGPDSPDANPIHAPASVPSPPSSGTPSGLARWFDPSTAPFIPVPLIDTDPDSGTTVGILPTILLTNDQHEITRIIAPDILYNPNFGFGAHMRLFDYPSEDKQWSIVVGAKQRVEREFDLEYVTGRERKRHWSFTGSLVYDRSGSPRFYGVGNETPLEDQTNYTANQGFVQGQIGLNFSRSWQLLYTARLRIIDVLPGTLKDVPSIETKFGPDVLGTDREVLNRLSLIFDNLDDLTVPSRGLKLAVYTGIASRTGIFNESLYSEAGVDGRAFMPLTAKTTLVSHMALRYLPTVHDPPFWALSSVGGGVSQIGGPQLLRGFGEGRFYDRNSFSYSVEVRQRVFVFNAGSSHIELQVAPFVDLGKVFETTGASPISQLHKVVGVGFRGIARPFVVGYVDIGYGTEGSAVFTGINYPF